MSIPHLQDLPLADFISALTNLHTLQVTEKLDGANLIVGVDAAGNFYTSREGKSGVRYYYDDEWPNTPAGIGFKNAHNFLLNHPQTFKSIKPGSAYECEVLFGRQPNAIVYGMNRVVFLRPIFGDDGITSPSIDTLSEFLTNARCINTPTTYFKSDDGLTIEEVVKRQPWSVDPVPHVDVELFTSIDVREPTSLLMSWLDDQRKLSFGLLTHKELLRVNLNKYPKSDRDEVKVAREYARKIFLDYKIKIVENYIDALKNTESRLRTVDVDSSGGIGIEGVVFLNTETQKQFKIVNRKEFTTINCFNHVVRNNIRKLSYAVLPFDTIYRGDIGMFEHRQSLYDQFLQKVAAEHNIPGLDCCMSLKRTIRKMSGDTMDDTLDALVNAWESDLHIVEIRHKFDIICTNSLYLLHEAIHSYSNRVAGFVLELEDDRWVGYTPEIHNRTLLCFAELHQELINIRDSARFATSKRQILEILFQKQLLSIH